MKKMQKINLLKKADVLNEKDMKLLIGGEREPCGGGGYHLYSCAWIIHKGEIQHAFVCAYSVPDAEDKLKTTIYNQLQETPVAKCEEYK